jgi:hypothetical protein
MLELCILRMQEAHTQLMSLQKLPFLCSKGRNALIIDGAVVLCVLYTSVASATSDLHNMLSTMFLYGRVVGIPLLAVAASFYDMLNNYYFYAQLWAKLIEYNRQCGQLNTLIDQCSPHCSNEQKVKLSQLTIDPNQFSPNWRERFRLMWLLSASDTIGQTQTLPTAPSLGR